MDIVYIKRQVTQKINSSDSRQSKNVEDVRNYESTSVQDGKAHQCNKCSKTFTSLQGLKAHNQHHTGQYSYFCDQCRRGFVTKSNYENHKRGHDGRGYSCDYCGKLFKSPTGLKYHMAEHTRKYKFTCEICAKGFHENKPFIKHKACHI